MAKPAPISRTRFNATARPVTVKIGDSLVGNATPKEFSTGSYGFGFQGKTLIEIDGVAVPCQVSLNVTVIGSKPGQADAA